MLGDNYDPRVPIEVVNKAGKNEKPYGLVNQRLCDFQIYKKKIFGEKDKECSKKVVVEYGPRLQNCVAK